MIHHKVKCSFLSSETLGWYHRQIAHPKKEILKVIYTYYKEVHKVGCFTDKNKNLLWRLYFSLLSTDLYLQTTLFKTKFSLISKKKKCYIKGHSQKCDGCSITFFFFTYLSEILTSLWQRILRFLRHYWSLKPSHLKYHFTSKELTRKKSWQYTHTSSLTKTFYGLSSLPFTILKNFDLPFEKKNMKNTFN